MLNRAETVQCEISSSAVDDLAGGVSGGPAGREAQFLTVRYESSALLRPSSRIDPVIIEAGSSASLSKTLNDSVSRAVQQPTKFELEINSKTPKTLGHPATPIARADKVVDGHPLGTNRT